SHLTSSVSSCQYSKSVLRLSIAICHMQKRILIPRNAFYELFWIIAKLFHFFPVLSHRISCFNKMIVFKATRYQKKNKRKTCNARPPVFHFKLFGVRRKHFHVSVKPVRRVPKIAIQGVSFLWAHVI